LSQLGESLAGSQGRERDVAEWTIAADVVRRIDDHEPGTFQPRHSAGWTREEHEFIESIRSRENTDIDQIRQQAEGNPYAFGKWRVMVLDFEELEARKLVALWWAFQVFERLAKLESSDTQTLNRQQMRIADCLRIRWRAHLDKIPATDPRGWATRGSRRFDLLPKSWRFV
jgi:hypothetical protein